MITKDEMIIGDIVGLAFGGQGILRHDGFVVFVPFTAPGDKIKCRITEKKKSFATGELVELITPSPQRIKPGCQYFGICGGCQLQHIDYAAQLEYKRINVEDALKRIGKIPLEGIPAVIPAKQQWAYRRHITLTMVPHNGNFAAGFFSVDNQSLVNIRQCPIFSEKEDPIIQQVQQVAGRLKSSEENDGRAFILKQDNGKYIVNFSMQMIPRNAKEECENALSHYSNWQGVIISDQAASIQFGVTTTSCKVEEMTFEFIPQVFIQNHPEQSGNIYRHVCKIAKQSGVAKILDLYCGIGISTILLAKQGADVVGIEFNKESIRLAKANARSNSVKNASFIASDVRTVLKDNLNKHKPGLVVVNPPRTGMDPRVTQMLVQNGSRELIYISCMPATLARDLQQFSDKYDVASCQSFDMFPQTAHVETVVHLKRKG